MSNDVQLLTVEGTYGYRPGDVIDWMQETILTLDSPSSGAWMGGPMLRILGIVDHETLAVTPDTRGWAWRKFRYELQTDREALYLWKQWKLHLNLGNDNMNRSTLPGYGISIGNSQWQFSVGIASKEFKGSRPQKFEFGYWSARLYKTAMAQLFRFYASFRVYGRIPEDE